MFVCLFFLLLLVLVLVFVKKKVKRGKVYINGKPTSETFVAEAPKYSMSPLVVPEKNVSGSLQNPR